MLAMQAECHYLHHDGLFLAMALVHCITKKGAADSLRNFAKASQRLTAGNHFHR